MECFFGEIYIFSVRTITTTAETAHAKPSLAITDNFVLRDVTLQYVYDSAAGGARVYVIIIFIRKSLYCEGHRNYCAII